MKSVLVIGGTQFVGRAIVEELINAGEFDITLFNRGKTNRELFPSLKKIFGDRKKKEDVAKFAQKDWDAIVDVSGIWPTALEQQLEAQTGRVGRYVYISTSSHYQFDRENPHLIKEDEPIVPCSAEEKASDERRFYNQHKAECERILQAQTDLDLIILRPGLIVGEYDHTDRLYYWFHKVQTQEQILIANGGKDLLAYSDVNDLARAVVKSLDIDNQFSVYGAHSYNASLLEFINVVKKKLGRNPQLVSASPDFLEQHAVSQWSGLPLWLNGSFLILDNSRIHQDFKLDLSDLNQTVDKLISYYENELAWRDPVISPSPISIDKEQELISFLN
ncbi:MAG: NAD-dependent epimerase/dehydratase family protein [Chloroflexota bacterium]